MNRQLERGSKFTINTRPDDLSIYPSTSSVYLRVPISPHNINETMHHPFGPPKLLAIGHNPDDPDPILGIKPNRRSSLFIVLRERGVEVWHVRVRTAFWRWYEIGG